MNNKLTLFKYISDSFFTCITWEYFSMNDIKILKNSKRTYIWLTSWCFDILSLQLLHTNDVVPGAVQQVWDIRTPKTWRWSVSVPSVICVRRTRRRFELGRLVWVGSRWVCVHAHPMDRYSVHTYIAMDAVVRAPTWR